MKLTPRQRDVLAFIGHHRELYGWSPTQAEMLAGLGLSSRASLARHLDALEAKGYIARDASAHRAIQILKQERPRHSTNTPGADGAGAADLEGERGEAS